MVFVQFALRFAASDAGEDHLSLTENALQWIKPKILLVKESIEVGKLMTAIFHFGLQAQRPVLKRLPEQVNHAVTPRRHDGVFSEVD